MSYHLKSGNHAGLKQFGSDWSRWPDPRRGDRRIRRPRNEGRQPRFWICPSRGILTMHEALAALGRRGFLLLLTAHALLASTSDAALQRGLRAAREGNCTAALSDLAAVISANPRFIP